MPHYWYLHQILIFILHIGLHLKTSIPCHKFTELVVDLVDDLVDVGRKLLLAVLQLFGVLLLPLRQLNNFDGQPVPENKQKTFWRKHKFHFERELSQLEEPRYFLVTRLPLPRTRWVRSTFSSLCPLPSNQCWPKISATSIFFRECWESNPGRWVRRKSALCTSVLCSPHLPGCFYGSTRYQP